MKHNFMTIFVTMGIFFVLYKGQGHNLVGNQGIDPVKFLKTMFSC